MLARDLQQRKLIFALKFLFSPISVGTLHLHERRSTRQASVDVSGKHATYPHRQESMKQTNELDVIL